MVNVTTVGEVVPQQSTLSQTQSQHASLANITYDSANITTEVLGNYTVNSSSVYLPDHVTTVTGPATTVTTTSTGAAAMIGMNHGGGGGGEATLGAILVEPEEEEKTIIGIPVRLLWIPYVSLGLILVLLMLVSFIRYHRKHGHKYQQRRIELWKKFNMENLMEQLQEGVETVGGIASMGPPNGGLNISPSTSSAQHGDNRPPDVRPKKKRRRPLFFTTNLNGSMVDVRCSNSSQTFRSSDLTEELAAVDAAAAEFTAAHPQTLEQLDPGTGAGSTASSSLFSSLHNKGKSKAKTAQQQQQQQAYLLAQGAEHSSSLAPGDASPPMLPLLPGPSPSQFKYRNSPVIWTLTRPRSSLHGLRRTSASFFSSPMDIQADEIEMEDDEVFLLSQSQL